MRWLRRMEAACFMLLLCSGPAFGVEPIATPPASVSFFKVAETDPALAGDARLDRKITLDEDGTPFRSLLKKASDAGLTLSCAPICADRKLQVRVKDRSLRSLMEALAQLTPGTWHRLDTGYRLEADKKAADYEDRWWQIYSQERERMKAALSAAILAEMRKEPYIPLPGTPDPENFPPEMFTKVAQSQQFWNDFPASLQEAIAAQIVDTAYYRAGPTFINRTTEGAVVVPFSALSLEAQSLALANAAQLMNGHQMAEPVAMSFNNIGFYVFSQIGTAQGQWYSMMPGIHVETGKIAPTLSLDHRDLPERVKQMGMQAPETWRLLAAYQESRVWPNFPSGRQPNGTERQPIVIGGPGLPPRRAEVLDWLADKAGLEFVADYYSVTSMPMSLAEKKQRLSRPLKQELDFRAAQEDMNWKGRTDGLYLFRDNRWYRDDRLEVPEDTLQDLLTKLHSYQDAVRAAPPDAPVSEESGVKQLDLMNEVVTELTPFQIANGLSNYVPEAGSRTFDPVHPAYVWRPFGLIAESALTDYHTLLFFSTLSPSQADALLAGRLPGSDLSDQQEQEAAYLLPDLQVRLGNPQQGPLLLDLQTDTPMSLTQFGYGRPPASEPRTVPLQFCLAITPVLERSGF